MTNLIHNPAESVKEWPVALEMLKEGNKRFVANAPIQKDYAAARAATATAQKPFAAILTCADSRTCPEIFFDQAIGDIFVVRNAGNFADQEAIGSIEFCTKHLGAPLVVVVGHTMCGAVFNSHDDATGLSEHLQHVLENIKGVIAGCTTKEEATETNTKAQVAALKNNPVIQEVGAMVVGADYNIASGVVTWLD